MKLFWRTLAVLGLIAGIFPLLPANIAVADDAVVGSGSAVSCNEIAFDGALAQAHLNGSGEITFNCGGPATISLANLKTILTTNSITINGGNEITLDGTPNSDGMFQVQNDSVLSLVGITIQNSTRAFSGGAIFVAGGTLNVVNSSIRDNTATGVGSAGGAIFNAGGTVDIDSSTLNGNSAPESGGAIFHSGGSLTITQSTLTDNSSTLASGGAIGQNAGTTTVEASTLSENSAGGTGGAIAVLGGSATLERSIVAGNTAPGGGANCFSAASLTSLDYNLSNDVTCPFVQTNDIQNSANVALGTLADNGGPTMTMLPGEESDAVDAAGDCVFPVDQRGEERPSADACDIGSVEVQIIPSSTYTLCASRYTGQVTSPFNGVCNPNSQYELVTPDAYPLAFCLSYYTGAVKYSFGRACPAGTRTYVVPDDGDLLTCVSVYTGHHRFVWNHSQCKTSERPNTIYGG